MNSQIRFLSSVSAALLILAGCAAVEPVKPQADPRLDHLVAGIDQCLARQAEAGAQLQEQARQMQLQSQQLQELQAADEQRRAASEAPAATLPPVATPCPKPARAATEQVVGYQERVWLPDLEFALNARMDTGVQTGALDARNVQQFERDGKRWVKFDVVNPETGKPRTLEHKLRSTVASSGEDATRHPVVKLGIVIGRVNKTAEFVVYERSHKTYQLTLGRNILQDLLVDASKQNIAPYVLPKKTAGGEGAAQ